jgi:leucyl aminopeptidase
MVTAAVEGARLGAYRFDRYTSTGQVKRLTVVVSSPVERGQRTAATTANVISDGVHLARDLVNTAPNHLGPADFATIASTHAAELPIAVKVWDDKALRRGGFGGLTAVGQGSARGPRLVRLSYSPAKAPRHVALVGKGITFDSGGLSLKPAKAMEWMKSDMGGAAAVLATVLAAARLKLPLAVTGWLALAENMPSGTAQRPGDVITIRGGTTIEVLNTDAEGRLVLADSIVEAVKEHPDALIDVATLTGAQLVALGSRVAGAMGNDDTQRAAVVAAADACGEGMWPMPLPVELRASLDSAIADMANIGDRNGGMLTAALFLKEFVPDDLPWTHLDIAGPAFNEGASHDYTPKGGTGFGVRTLLQFLRDQE